MVLMSLYTCSQQQTVGPLWTDSSGHVTIWERSGTQRCDRVTVLGSKCIPYVVVPNRLSVSSWQCLLVLRTVSLLRLGWDREAWCWLDSDLGLLQDGGEKILGGCFTFVGPALSIRSDYVMPHRTYLQTHLHRTLWCPTVPSCRPTCTEHCDAPPYLPADPLAQGIVIPHRTFLQTHLHRTLWCYTVPSCRPTCTENCDAPLYLPADPLAQDTVIPHLFSCRPTCTEHVLTAP